MPIVGKIANQYKDCLEYIESYWSKIVVKNPKGNSNAHWSINLYNVNIHFKIILYLPKPLSGWCQEKIVKESS